MKQRLRNLALRYAVVFAGLGLAALGHPGDFIANAGYVIFGIGVALVWKERTRGDDGK